MEPHFEGVIGRDWRTSTPWWPPDPEPPAGAPNVLMLVLDDVGFAQLGCYGSDIATPDVRRPRRATASGSPTSTRPRCARRPARACSPGATTTATAWAASPTSRSATPGYWGRIPRENGFLSEILRAPRLRDLRGRQVAPHARRRDAHGRRRARRGRSPAASTVGTGSTAARPTSSCRRCTTTTIRCCRPASPEDGYHLSADLADRAIGFLGDLRAVDADRPFFCYFATGACHSPHHAPQEWIERYRGQFDGGLGRVARGHVRAPDRERRAPGAHEAVAPPALGARVGLAEGRGPRGRGPVHGVLRRVPLVHRRADRAPARVPRPDRRPRQHAGRRRVRQRRERRGRAEGFDQRRPPDERRARRPARAARPHRRDRRPDRAQQLPVGLDDGGQHAVQALEARGARRRRRRPVHRVAARVDARASTAAGPGASSRTRSTCSRRCSSSSGSKPPATIDGIAQSRVDGDELRARAARRGARPSRTRRSTSRCSGRGASTTAAGRR